MTFVIAIAYVSSIIWVAWDASQRDFSASRVATNAVWWVVGMVVLWILVFPLYLFSRDNAPLKGVAPGNIPAPMMPPPAVPPVLTKQPPPPPFLSTPVSAEEPIVQAEQKQCPDCAEMIKKEAKVCRFCGHNLL